MNLAKMKATAKLAGNRNLLKFKKNSPAILMYAGIAGMLGTAVTASMATLKLELIIDQMDEQLVKAKRIQAAMESGEMETDEVYNEKTLKRAQTIVYAKGVLQIGKLYAPSFFLGAASIAAIISGHTILDKRNVLLAASYATLDKTFGNYREKVKDAFGFEKERELYTATVSEDVIDPATGEKVETFPVTSAVSMYGRWFNKENKNWEPNETSNLAFLRSQQNYLNDLLKARGHVMLNDVYEALGFDHTSAGQLVGWIWGKDTGDEYIDFGIFPDSTDANRVMKYAFGEANEIFLDFNVDGVVYDLI